jgi:hypothetical protein
MLQKQMTVPASTECNKTSELIKREEATARTNLLRELAGYVRATGGQTSNVRGLGGRGGGDRARLN